MKLSTLLESTTLPRVSSLDDLKGATEPVNVTGAVILHSLKLARLPVKFGEVGGEFWCSRNQLTSLEGAPSQVGGDFWCSYNQLTSLEGDPSQVGGYFDCPGNKLTSLEGAPSQVGGDFDCSNNKLTSLVGIHKIIKSCNGIHLSKNPIKEGGLGLLLIKDLEYIWADQPALEIIRKYLGKGKRGMIDCQTELIKAGYKEYAKL